MKSETTNEIYSVAPGGNERPKGQHNAARRPNPARMELQENKLRGDFQQSFRTFIKQFLLLNFVDANISLKTMVNDFEAELIRAALRLTNGHQVDAATYLGVKPTTLCEKIKKHGIKASKSGGIISNRDIFHMYVMELFPYVSREKE
jgi:DNA-binding NtrC family response regulator